MRKYLIILCLIMLSIFLFGEGVQRARYYVRYDDPYWLKYGFSKLGQSTVDKQRMDELKKVSSTFKDLDPKRVFLFNIGEPEEGYAKYKPGCYVSSTIKGTVTINSYGLRGREFKIPKPKGIYRILCIGESSTMGMWNTDDKTFPWILQDLLGGDYEVINGGLMGANFINLYEFLKTEIDTIDPDMVILYAGFNNWFKKKHATINPLLLKLSLR